MTLPVVNLVCMKWGTLYGPEYVNALHQRVKTHLHRAFRFVCFTDDASGLNPEIEAQPLPVLRLDGGSPDTRWRKLALLGERLGDLTGTTLFLDLDLVIVDQLDPFFEWPHGVSGVVPMIRDDELFRDKPLRRLRPQRDRFLAMVGNSSVFRFEVGAHADVLNEYLDDPQAATRQFEISQQFMSAALARRGQLGYWPQGWCVSFKNQCVPRHLHSYLADPTVPPGARIVVFAGNLKMADVLAGGGHRLHRADWQGGLAAECMACRVNQYPHFASRGRPAHASWLRSRALRTIKRLGTPCRAQEAGRGQPGKFPAGGKARWTGGQPDQPWQPGGACALHAGEHCARGASAFAACVVAGQAAESIAAFRETLRRLIARGLEVRGTDDVGPHTKYFPPGDVGAFAHAAIGHRRRRRPVPPLLAAIAAGSCRAPPRRHRLLPRPRNRDSAQPASWRPTASGHAAGPPSRATGTS